MTVEDVWLRPSHSITTWLITLVAKNAANTFRLIGPNAQSNVAPGLGPAEGNERLAKAELAHGDRTMALIFRPLRPSRRSFFAWPYSLAPPRRISARRRSLATDSGTLGCQCWRRQRDPQPDPAGAKNRVAERSGGHAGQNRREDWRREKSGNHEPRRLSWE